MLHRTFWTERRFTGITLIIGCILFLTAAGLSPTDEKGTYMYDLPMREALIAVFHRWSTWQWGLLLFCIAVVVTLLGFARLTSILKDAGNRAFSSSGLIALALATVFILIDMTFRWSIEYGAALVSTRILPRWLGWVIMAYSLVGIVLFALAGDMPPFVHHLLPIVIGILLLLPRYQHTSKIDCEEELPLVASLAAEKHEVL